MPSKKSKQKAAGSSAASEHTKDDIDALLDSLEAEAVSTPKQGVVSNASQNAAVAKQEAGKADQGPAKTSEEPAKKGKKAPPASKGVQNEDDLDDILAEFEATLPTDKKPAKQKPTIKKDEAAVAVENVETQIDKSKAEKNRQKKLKKKQAKSADADPEDSDDEKNVDSDEENLAADAAEEADEENASSSAKAVENEVVDEQEGDEVDENDRVGSKTLKNRLKKQKRKQQAQQQLQTAEGDTSAVKNEQKKPLKKVPQSVAAKALFELVQQNRAREEEERKAQEEQRKQAEELERREEEERRLQEEEKARKKKEKLDRKLEILGTDRLLSHKDKLQQQRNQAYLEHLKASGMIRDTDEKRVAKLKKADKPKKSQQLDEEKKEMQTEEGNVDAENKNEDEEEEEEEEEKTPYESVVDNWEDILVKQAEEAALSALKDKGLEASNTMEADKKHSTSSSTTDIKKTSKSTGGDQSLLQSEAVNKPRSPICCILGHVDTGKTKLLDKIRHTNVQDDEAGGITQQIGATYFPTYALLEQAVKVNPDLKLSLPGLLIIDTPGHESFNNLRDRGSSLCDIAILVIDIMHGLEPQTRESLGLLRSKKCPFVVALNKIDRMYGWIVCDWQPFQYSLSKQHQSAKDEFERRLQDTMLQLQEEGINSQVYWDNNDLRGTTSIAPTSAITGEGIPDLLYLIITLSQTRMSKSLQSKEELKCTILDVKHTEGFGVTIDVILINGTLYEGDNIIVCGMSGPIVTTIRAILTPQPLKELRVKSEYIHHLHMEASMGLKLAAPGLDEAVAGTSLRVFTPSDDIESLKREIMSDMADIFKSVDRSGLGVYVMASTLGSLEALLQFLKTSEIPVFAVNLGTVQKKDVKKAGIMSEKGRPDLAVILAFDIKIDPEAEKEAQSLGVKILAAEIIYHLFDDYLAYKKEVHETKKKEQIEKAVFPCELSILPQYIFNKKDPLVFGVRVDAGSLRVGTPLIIMDKEPLLLGKVSSLEHNKKVVNIAAKGQEVAVKIIGDPSITYGRHFSHTNKVYSRLTRESIDCLKEVFRAEVPTEDWKLIVSLKKVLSIP